MNEGGAEEGRAPIGARLAAVGARAGLDFAYLAVGLATAALAFCVWVTALSLTISLLVFVVGLPLFLLSAIAFRWTAELDRRNAALALGEPLRGHYRDHSGSGFFERLSRTATDLQTWKDLTWLVFHSVLGFGLGTAAIAVVGATLGTALLPVWFWAVPEGVDYGFVNVGSLGEAVAVAPLAIPMAALSALLLRAMAIAESRLAEALLGGGAETEGAAAPRLPMPDPRALLTAHLALSAFVLGVVLVVWVAADRGTFWPVWVAFGLGVPLALHLAVRLGMWAPPERQALALHASIAVVLAATAVVLWLLAGTGNFWPIWVLLGLAITLGLHLIVEFLWQRVFPDERERELAERVDELTRTRRGALDVQAAELARIERDLHDGAQARLVSLSMRLGRAEERLADQPETAALLRQARDEASAAIAELRDLARGIAPPVLADRGLGAAVEALGRRAAIPVSVEVDLAERPPGVIESAAYFVVAEALTNVAKHAPEAEAAVAVARAGDVLLVEVIDNGPGGADREGGGLAGLRGRVEALDGRLTVSSPSGAGTTIRAELPCVS